jgi:hypothetical protein
MGSKARRWPPNREGLDESDFDDRVTAPTSSEWRELGKLDSSRAALEGRIE